MAFEERKAQFKVELVFMSDGSIRMTCIDNRKIPTEVFTELSEAIEEVQEIVNKKAK